MSTPLDLTVPDGVVPRSVDVGGARLAVLDAPAARREPTRATVVLVPGYTGSKEDFLPLLRPLAEAGHRVVAYDQRGQHESPGPDEPSAYAVEALAADLLALVDLLGDGPVHVVGHSFGGLVARAAALADRDRMRSLALLGSGPAAIDGQRAALIRTLRPVLDEHGPDAVWQRMAELAAAQGAPAAPPEVATFLRTRFFASSPAGLRAMGEQLLDEPDRVDDLRATGLPVLVAHGEHDDAWPPAVQAAMASRLAARYHPVPGAVHSPNVEAPEHTAQLLVAFWADVEGGDQATTTRNSPSRTSTMRSM